jgi:hypothetical protein
MSFGLLRDWIRNLDRRTDLRRLPGAYARARDRVAQEYMRAFVRARANRMQPGRMAFPLQAAERNATSRLIKCLSAFAAPIGRRIGP